MDTFYEKTISFLKTINTHYNIIHIRLEKDAIDHWSKENNTTAEHFKFIIEQKYIELIKNYIDKNTITVILSGDYNNNVVSYLKDNHYHFVKTHKNYEDRELNAINDLIISENSYNTFIGVFESSFSYTCAVRIKKRENQQLLLFEMNNLNNVYLFREHLAISYE